MRQQGSFKYTFDDATKDLRSYQCMSRKPRFHSAIWQITVARVAMSKLALRGAYKILHVFFLELRQLVPDVDVLYFVVVK